MGNEQGCMSNQEEAQRNATSPRRSRPVPQPEYFHGGMPPRHVKQQPPEALQAQHAAAEEQYQYGEYEHEHGEQYAPAGHGVEYQTKDISFDAAAQQHYYDQYGAEYSAGGADITHEAPYAEGDDYYAQSPSHHHHFSNNSATHHGTHGTHHGPHHTTHHNHHLGPHHGHHGNHQHGHYTGPNGVSYPRHPYHGGHPKGPPPRRCSPPPRSMSDPIKARQEFAYLMNNLDRSHGGMSDHLGRRTQQLNYATRSGVNTSYETLPLANSVGVLNTHQRTMLDDSSDRLGLRAELNGFHRYY